MSVMCRYGDRARLPGGATRTSEPPAVEMCHNNAIAEFDAGTMCPSYRVTRDEQT